MPIAMAFSEAELGLFIDLYELTMAQAYRAEDMNERAVFTLHFRELPRGRNFILACGQHYAAQLVPQLRFPQAQIEQLAQLHRFDDAFLSWLANFHFSGDIRALPEGTPVFAHEPLLEVEAPIAEGQLLESLLMNLVMTESVLASKAVRMVAAAQGRPVVDFGMRRMHGVDAALRGVRAYRIAGIQSTSNVLGSLRYGLPASGTMAHSYVQAHESEIEAFRSYARLYPGTTLLVDTYDTLAAVDKVITLVRDEGFRIGAIRLDSGDLVQLAKQARRKLDEAGLNTMRIVLSSSLDEWKIQKVLAAAAPVDGFGVGTELGVPSDVPTLDLVYKLTEYAGSPRLKISPGKKLLPGRKQVWRFIGPDGRYCHDEITQADEVRDGQPLLTTVVRRGRAAGSEPDLDESRSRVQKTLTSLPDYLRSLEVAERPYEVRVSESLEQAYQQARAAVGVKTREMQHESSNCYRPD